MEETGKETATVERIGEALKQIESKKQSLKRAYDDLYTHSPTLFSSSSSSFSLSWSDLDTHFSSLQSSLTHRYNLLLRRIGIPLSDSHPQITPDKPLLVVSADNLIDPSPKSAKLGGSAQSTVVSAQNKTSPPPQSAQAGGSGVKGQDQPPLSAVSGGSGKSQVVPVEKDNNPLSGSGSDPLGSNGDVLAESKLLTLCKIMDGKGLRDYVKERYKERESIRVELVSALRVALNPGSLVLDAMDGFYTKNLKSKGDKDTELLKLRRCCLDLLNMLLEIRPRTSLSDEEKERAKELALEWKRRAKLDDENSTEATGVLALVAAYGLESEFDMSELVDYFVVASKFPNCVVLCRHIGLGDKVADLIQKLIDCGKSHFAANFALEFGLSTKFPPVPLLKAQLEKSKQFTEKVWNDGMRSIKDKNIAKTREMAELKSVLKIIKDHNLGSEYPVTELNKRIEILKKQKVDSEIPTPSSSGNHPRPQQKQEPKQEIQPPKQQKQEEKQDTQSKKQQKHQSKQHQNGNKRPRTLAASSSFSIPRPYGQPLGSLPTINPVGLLQPTYINPHVPVAPVYLHESNMPHGYYGRPDTYPDYGYPPQYRSGFYPR